MAPPPATPTPHRFLVPKRSQPRNETPKAFQSGGQQFQATPRFSLHSTPRGPGGGGGSSHAPSSSIITPAPSRIGAGAFVRPTPRNTDPINDIVDSSPPFGEQQPEGDSNQRDSIDIIDVDTDVDAIPESSPAQRRSSDYVGNSEGEEEDLGSPSPKRRRISISSDFGTDDQVFSRHEGENVEEDLVMQEGNIQSSLPDYELQLPDDEETDTSLSPFLLRHPVSAQQQQPTFQKAPRFKPTEAPEGSYRGDPLPDAFSPHRKGAKYVPGGLAAEVRDWFVDVWASAGAGAVRRDGAGGEGEWAARIAVDEVRAAPGMTLVVGRHIARQDNEHEHEHEHIDNLTTNSGDVSMRGARIMLAGSPRITGLEKKREVRPGVVVGVGKPTWEVLLPGQGQWVVACEWAVLS